jgi:hypothetical protein
MLKLKKRYFRHRGRQTNDVALRDFVYFEQDQRFRIVHARPTRIWNYRLERQGNNEKVLQLLTFCKRYYELRRLIVHVRHVSWARSSHQNRFCIMARKTKATINAEIPRDGTC